MNAFLALVGRELRLAMRQGGDSLTAVLFFVLAALLFPFGLGPEPQVLARDAVGIVWVMALLAALLALDRLFQSDWEDGSLDLMALSPLPLEAVALAKALSHWLLSGLPLILAAPLVATMLQLEPAAVPRLLGAIALGTPTLSLLGTVGAALTLGARRGGVLVSLLVLPLEVPLLIFGVAAADPASLAGNGPLMVMGGLLMGSLALCPWAAAAALRLALE